MNLVDHITGLAVSDCLTICDTEQKLIIKQLLMPLEHAHERATANLSLWRIRQANATSH